MSNEVQTYQGNAIGCRMNALIKVDLTDEVLASIAANHRFDTFCETSQLQGSFFITELFGQPIGNPQCFTECPFRLTLKELME